ncbi:MAG: glycosyltransferase family 39 protein [Candidatus Niyogibacteria bacterium]|nr:MAG: glycosyltransferase family 39 protein [Candidatus Niyogibacteria bacterium]
MKNNKIIVLIIFASLAVSLAYSFYFKITPAVDAAAYDKIAWNLTQGNGYKENADLSYEEDIAILRVGPGYQFFLAGIYSIFGRNLGVVWIINAILHALSVLFVFLLSREVFKENSRLLLGFTAAALIGFSPDLITMSGMLMTETLAIFLIILSVYLFFRYINSVEKPFWLVIVSALVFGFAIMVRTPIALMILPVLYYFYAGGQLKKAAVFIIILAALFSPWIIRNYKIYNVFIPTNYAFGYDLLVGNHLGSTGELEPYEPAERYVYEYSRVEGNRQALGDALTFIAGHPFEFLKITAQRISIYFSFARPTGFWFHLEGEARAATLALSAIYSALIFGLGFWGIYRAVAQNRVLQMHLNARLLFWIFIMVPLAVIFIIVETRYRFLAYPLLAVFAGFGLSDLSAFAEDHGCKAVDECEGRTLRSSESEGGCFGGFRRRNEGYHGRKPVEASFNGKLELKPMLVIWGILLLNSAIDIMRNLERVAEKLKELI